MSIDKRISYDYVDQDGYKNYTKNSDSVTVPRKFKARKNAPATKLAYITDAEAKQLKKQNPGTPHKGPKGIPSYDSFDADGSFTSGAAMSAAESGKNTSDTLAAGMTGKDVQDIRSSVIAAGAGQRVNPGLFDSRDLVSPDELARARAFNPAAFRQGRGGIMNLLTGGGFFGNLLRGIGQAFGLGKTYDQPTYDMSRFSGLPVGGSATFQNLDIRDKFNRGLQNVLPATTIDEFGYSDDFLSSLVNEYGVKDRGLTVAPADGLPAIAMSRADQDMGSPQEVVQTIVEKVESGQPLSNDEQLIFDENVAILAGKSF